VCVQTGRIINCWWVNLWSSPPTNVSSHQQTPSWHPQGVGLHYHAHRCVAFNDISHSLLCVNKQRHVCLCMVTCVCVLACMFLAHWCVCWVCVLICCLHSNSRPPANLWPYSLWREWTPAYSNGQCVAAETIGQQKGTRRATAAGGEGRGMCRREKKRQSGWQITGRWWRVNGRRG